MDRLDRLIQLAHQLARYGTWFGGGLIIIAAFIVSYEVIIRKFFGTTLGGADELSTFCLAIGSAWAFSFTMLERAHVRIESLYVTLPTRLCAILDMISHTIFTVIIAIMTYYCYFVFQNSYEMNARTLSELATPVAIPQFLWSLGMFYFLFVALLLHVRSTVALVTGDFDTVQRYIGTRSTKQEIEEEMEQVARHGEPLPENATSPTSEAER